MNSVFFILFDFIFPYSLAFRFRPRLFACAGQARFFKWVLGSTNKYKINLLIPNTTDRKTITPNTVASVDIAVIAVHVLVVGIRS